MTTEATKAYKESLLADWQSGRVQDLGPASLEQLKAYLTNPKSTLDCTGPVLLHWPFETTPIMYGPNQKPKNEGIWADFYRTVNTTQKLVFSAQHSKGSSPDIQPATQSEEQSHSERVTFVATLGDDFGRSIPAQLKKYLKRYLSWWATGTWEYFENQVNAESDGLILESAKTLIMSQNPEVPPISKAWPYIRVAASKNLEEDDLSWFNWETCTPRLGSLHISLGSPALPDQTPTKAVCEIEETMVEEAGTDDLEQ